MRAFFECLKLANRFPGYRPQPINFVRVFRWLSQFEKADRKLILKLLDRVIYFSEERIEKALYDQNRALMDHLETSGLSPDQIIYVQVDEAGSSSPVMLNKLRDAAGLQKLGCHLLDGKNVKGIVDLTNKLGTGAIIYVDDFVGSGTQLRANRTFIAQNITANFSEFLIVPSICEEGLVEIGKMGIDPFVDHIHAKAERPLHPNSSVFDQETKDRLIQICDRIDSRVGIGFGGGAVMIVLYRGPPDNVPVIFRGSDNQSPYTGLFPRYIDLPLRKKK